jgi:hypothetical protein
MMKGVRHVLVPKSAYQIVVFVLGASARIRLYSIGVYCNQIDGGVEMDLVPGMYTLCVCGPYSHVGLRVAPGCTAFFSRHEHFFKPSETFTVVVRTDINNTPLTLRKLCMFEAVYRGFSVEILPLSVKSKLFRPRNINSDIENVLNLPLCVCSDMYYSDTEDENETPSVETNNT